MTGGRLWPTVYGLGGRCVVVAKRGQVNAFNAKGLDQEASIAIVFSQKVWHFPICLASHDPSLLIALASVPQETEISPSH
jgi:hypothetical protein